MTADRSTLPDDDPARPLRELAGSGRFREVLETYEAASDQLRQRPDAQLLAATAATRLGQFSLGVSLAEGALERFRSRADSDGRMRAMNLLGVIAFEHGRPQDAERAFGEVLELARLMNDSLMTAHASNNLASVADLRSKPDVALTLYRSALLAYQRLGDRRGTAQTYHNLGVTFRQLSEWQDAERAALEAVRHAEQVGESSLVALVVAGRAETHVELGEFELASRELDRGLALARDAGDPVGAAEVGRVRALLALARGAYALALEEAQAAGETARAHHVLQLEAECAAAAAIALHRLGREEESLERRARAEEVFERLGAVRLLAELERSWNLSQ